MIAISIASIVAASVVGCCWLVDVRLTRSRFAIRAQHALMLVGATAWLATIILLESWFLEPGVYASNLFWFRMRVVAVFLMFGCVGLAISMLIFTIANVVKSQPVAKWRLCVVPAVALALFALAWYLVGTHQFFPTA